MDAVEVISAIVGSVVLIAMFGLAGRRSWLDRQQAKHQTDQKIDVATA